MVGRGAIRHAGWHLLLTEAGQQLGDGQPPTMQARPPDSIDAELPKALATAPPPGPRYAARRPRRSARP